MKNLKFRWGILSYENDDGEIVFIPESIFTAEERQLADAYLEEHANDIPPAPTLDEVKAAKIQELETACNQDVRSGFISTASGEEILYGYDNSQLDPDQQNLSEMWIALTTGVLTPPAYYKGKGEVPLLPYTIEQFEQLVRDAAAHKLSKQMQYYQLKAQVLACETIKDVEAVSW